MGNQTNEALSLMAEKLGTTVEYLWAVLIKQAPIDATITSIQIAAVALAVYFWQKRLRLYLSVKDSYYSGNEGMAHFLLFAFTGVCLLVLAITAFLSIGTVVNGYLNPEYWALDKIIQSTQVNK